MTAEQALDSLLITFGFDQAEAIAEVLERWIDTDDPVWSAVQLDLAAEDVRRALARK